MLEGLDGKVAVVTGAGRGLGRAEALELARQGVRVVVNDLEQEGTGEGEPTEDLASAVAGEIRDVGGAAVVHHGDVADWLDAEALVTRAVEEWGRLDIVVNNAGFLRDRTLFNMSEEEWDAVVRVHLKGHFCVSRHATAHWRERAKASEEGRVYGRVVNTASEAFLSASPGQPNYAAAKAGIAALTLSTAQVMAKYGVTANVVCPRAHTRMTEGMPGFDASEDGWEVFAPENVAPLVAYLASPAASRVSGQVLVVYAKSISVLAAPTIDRRFDAEEPWTPESVAEALGPFYDEREPVADGFRARFVGG